MAERRGVIRTAGLSALFLFFSYTQLYAALPTTGPISPSSGSSSPERAITFTATYSDPDGSADIRYAAFLLYPSSSGNYALLLYEQTSNRLYLTSDINAGWSGGYAPSSPNTISNAYLSLDCSQTAVSTIGNSLTINWSLTAAPAFSGQLYTSLLLAIDKSGHNTNWTPKGSYAIDYNPQAGTITPSSGSSQPEQETEFTATFTDQDGSLNLQISVLAFSDGQNPPLLLIYDQSKNLLYLSNDTATGFMGGFSPGSAQSIENSFLKLICQTSAVTSNSNTLTLSLAVSFKLTKTTTLNSYLFARDNAASESGWQPRGSWTIEIDVLPPTGSIRINNNHLYTNSPSVSLNLLAQDNPDGSGIYQMQFSQDNLNWSPPETYALSKPWTLTSGEGLKTVYCRFSDKAGNWSEAYSDRIILDTTPPIIALTPVNSPTNQDVRLAYSLSDNFSLSAEITLSGDNSPYTREGSYEVLLTTTDLASNTSSQSISFTIDKTPPQIVISSPLEGAVLEEAQVQLTGTVDDIPFSESRSLVPGQNTLTKTASDAAGNTSSASVTVSYSPGTLIGPEGGEVVSSDAKIKLIIPPQALNDPTYLKVISLNKEELISLTPPEQNLLSVAEYKPYGLLFNQPITIIYTLDSPEIPGTPVELGLYDRRQNKITPLGHSSTVSADSYTITCSVLHFSTYALLKNLSSSPIGPGVKIPLPDLLTGSYSHSLPLTVPAGRKGLQPALSLTYRSSNPNSWVGLGFSLNPGYIIRSTRLGPPTYVDTQDTFYLITDAGTTELVHLIDNLYQAKIESSFSKFYKEPDDSWKAVAKDGSQLFFGQAPQAKESGSGASFSWYLTKAKDTNGNYLTYRYTQDQGKSYLSRIDYTGNDLGLLPANSLEFILEPRADIASNYLSGRRIATAKRLKSIEVRQGLDLVWRYNLEYSLSPDTNRSLLTKVTQSAPDGKALPAQGMSYQKSK